MSAIGIDLGTTYSCVGLKKDDNVDIFQNDMGNKITPSMVAFSPDREPVVGDAAKAQLPTNPTNTVFGAKRMIGKSFKDPNLQRDIATWPFQVIKGVKDRPKIRVSDRGKTKEFFPEEISAEVLKYLLQVARAKSGDPTIKDVVITVPAYFTDAQRLSTKEAGKIAGMNVLRIIPEPTAAAIAFGVSTEDEHTALIFDLGGGTFDVSILHLDGEVYEVKSILGDDHLGGEDFDNKLVEYLADQFNKKNGCDIKGNQRAMMLLKEQAENAKKTLSNANTATVYVESIFNGKDLNERVTRKQFEDLNKESFAKLIPIVRKAIDNAADVDKDDITDLLLVGGSSRIPYVQELLKKEFPSLTPCSTVHPDEAVAIGAAIHAYNLTHEDDDDDDNQIILVDACPMTRGLEVEGGKMEPIIKLNDSIPIEVTKPFTTTYDYQEAIGILIFEGENKLTKDNHFMGQFQIEGIPQKKKGEVTIDVTFELSEESILDVKASIKGTALEKKQIIRISDDKAPGEPIRKITIGGKSNSVDLLFVIDATGSMGSWLDAAVKRSQEIASTARRENPAIKFRFGAVFYRDPIDVETDENTFFDLTDNVDKLKEKMATQEPTGGGDGPEDWVGGYKIALNQISWDPKSSKAIIHIADAPAHGDDWGGHCKHQDQNKLLAPLIRECAHRKIFFQGINIGSYPKQSYEKISEIYHAEGGKCKIADFESGGKVSAADFLQDIAREVILTIAPK